MFFLPKIPTVTAIGFGATELIIVLVIILIIFGAGKLPKVMESLGSGIRSFKKAAREDETGDEPDEEVKPAKIAEKKVKNLSEGNTEKESVVEEEKEEKKEKVEA